jgi:rod shape-determining protein MreC
MDGTSWMNLFTINIGTEKGIKKGDVVVGGDGLVGRVKSVGYGWSKVVSIVDESSKISFKVSGNLKILGILDESSDGTLTGFTLDSEATVTEGDTLITSGMGRYPSGITIGKIIKVSYDSNEQLQKVTVRPSVDFKSLQKVSVLI